MWCHVTGALNEEHIVLSFNLMREDIMLLTISLIMLVSYLHND